MNPSPRDHERRLVALILNDPPTVHGVMAAGAAARSSLDDKTGALVRLGALCAIGASPSTYCGAADAALDAGATADEVVDTLCFVGPVIGTARLVAAAAEVAHGLGYDVDGALGALGDL